MLRHEGYVTIASALYRTFEFVSEGAKGKILKVVQFSETEVPGIYNLGFGDAKPSTNENDDRVISNNGDSQKVLATVIAAVYSFTDHYPASVVFATGSTRSRTRLYRIGISKNLREALADFEIWGSQDGRWERFSGNTDYAAFLARRR